MTYKDKYPNCEGCPVKSICDESLANSQVICEQMPDPQTLQDEWDEYIEAYYEYMSYEHSQNYGV